VGLGHGHYRASEWPGITPSGSSGSAGRVVSPARCTGAKGARVDQRLPLVPLCVVPHVPTRPGAYTLLLRRVLLSRDPCREHVGARRTTRYGHAVPSRVLQQCPSCARESLAYGSILEGRGRALGRHSRELRWAAGLPLCAQAPSEAAAGARAGRAPARPRRCALRAHSHPCPRPVRSHPVRRPVYSSVAERVARTSTCGA
jgi:hypothetical protein